MQHKKNQMSVGLMIQRCHRWRQKRKQYLDQARQTPDEIERERLLQMAEHYGRIVIGEQDKIDGTRDPKDKRTLDEDKETDNNDDDDVGFPDFLTHIK
jgi:predicted nucleic acid-binding protein